jgi:hypothetical protein
MPNDPIELLLPRQALRDLDAQLKRELTAMVRAKAPKPDPQSAHGIAQRMFAAKNLSPADAAALRHRMVNTLIDEANTKSEEEANPKIKYDGKLPAGSSYAMIADILLGAVRGNET